MIALRRSDVANVNHQARAAMVTAGRLSGPALHVGGHELRAGDRIVCLRNAPKLGVVNGTAPPSRTSTRRRGPSGRSTTGA
jgi:ATP-dependent exoDNAse (exonuclease V) alpha subunit